jgi:hypothetical protein
MIISSFVFTVCEKVLSTDLSATKPSALKTIMMGISCLMYGKMATILWPAKKKKDGHCRLKRTKLPESIEGENSGVCNNLLNHFAGYGHKKFVLWIRTGLNADPDPAFYLNTGTDPDPGSQTNAGPDPQNTDKNLHIFRSYSYCTRYLFTYQWRIS